VAETSRRADGQPRRRGWWRALPWVALPTLPLVGYFAFRTPEPARTAFALVEGVCNVRSPRARDLLLDAYVAESPSVQVEDEDHTWSKRRLTRDELRAQLDQILVAHPRCQLELEVTGVRGPEGSEWLEGELQFSESQAGDLHAEWRSVQVHFESVRGRRQLERVLLFAPERSLPEARP
jgi:hypothetical protein